MGLFDKLLKRKKAPIIMTEYGPVTESARRQAAENMKDPMIRGAVEHLLTEQYGEELGLAEARRRYPEAYDEE